MPLKHAKVTAASDAGAWQLPSQHALLTRPKDAASDAGAWQLPSQHALLARPKDAEVTAAGGDLAGKAADFEMMADAYYKSNATNGDTNGDTDGGRRQLQTCSAGSTIFVTSSEFPNLEGCMLEVDIFEGGEIEYLTEDGLGIIFAAQPTGETEEYWFAQYLTAASSNADQISACNSEEPASLVHPSEATWVCLFPDGSVDYATSTTFGVECGCDDDDGGVSTTPTTSTSGTDDVSPTPSGSCSDGSSIFITSSEFPNLEGCMSEFDIFEGGEIEYLTEEGLGIIFAAAPTGSTEEFWFAQYLTALTSDAEQVPACNSEEPASLVHPADATWICGLGDVGPDTLTVECGCDNVDAGGFSNTPPPLLSGGIYDRLPNEAPVEPLLTSPAPSAVSNDSAPFSETPAPTTVIGDSRVTDSPDDSNTTTIVAVSGAVAAVALVLIGVVCRRKRRRDVATKQGPSPSVESGPRGNSARGSDDPPLVHDGLSPFPEQVPGLDTADGQRAHLAAKGNRESNSGAGSSAAESAAPVATSRGNTSMAAPLLIGASSPPPGKLVSAPETSEGQRAYMPSEANAPQVAHSSSDPGKSSTHSSVPVTTSTGNISTAERADLEQSLQGRDVDNGASIADDIPPEGGNRGDVDPDVCGRRPSGGGVGVARAVMEAARDLALSSPIPGVSEAAKLVSILVDLVADDRDSKRGGEERLKRCRSIVILLQRASKVLGKSGDTNGEAERVLIQDVNDAIADLVELIKTYQSRSALSKVLMSTLFKRRQEEADAVIDRAASRLHLGLQVQVGHDVRALGRRMDAGLQDVRAEINLRKESRTPPMSDSQAEARRARRRRSLEQLEIPDGHVTITDELLGRGGFGAVYLCDFNGRNAAAKVIEIAQDVVDISGDDENRLRRGIPAEPDRDQSQRRAFLRELHAMIRLRSPHTINVYGAITSSEQRLVLVMELLVGGDLRTLLKKSDGPLPANVSRRIISDVCAGLAFLHSKDTIHGDLKSTNVLLDGAGRAKIGDFGTSKWTQHTDSTGLATYTTKAGKGVALSFAWTAPEVLSGNARTFASDVYSFGMVTWEIVSRQTPWAGQALPQDIYIRVVFRSERPIIPADAPADIVGIIQSCWAGSPERRPTASSVLVNLENFLAQARS